MALESFLRRNYDAELSCHSDSTGPPMGAANSAPALPALDSRHPSGSRHPAGNLDRLLGFSSTLLAIDRDPLGSPVRLARHQRPSGGRWQEHHRKDPLTPGTES